MKQALALLGGIGLGEGLMYFFDPDLGRRRRAQLRDRAIHLLHQTADGLNVLARDLGHRSFGLMHELTAPSRPEADDPTLTERVRAHIGRAVTHPHAVHVEAHDGRVTLSGPVLAHEVERLLDNVRRVPGVRQIDNRLEVHRVSGDVPGLQGGSGRRVRRVRNHQACWSSSTRLLACTAGGALMANCLARRTLPAAMLGTVGFGLFLRALGNRPLRRLLSRGSGRHTLDVNKSITIHAPVEEVFAYFNHYENFPRFMAHLEHVRDLGNGRSHWVATGPGGLRVSWNAVLTRVLPNELLAWRSEAGSNLANAGCIRFLPQSDGSTRVDVHMCYYPPAGALGHFAALLFGDDPKSAMDEDLIRLKSLIEDGKTRAPGKRTTSRELAGTVAGAACESGGLGI